MAATCVFIMASWPSSARAAAEAQKPESLLSNEDFETNAGGGFLKDIERVSVTIEDQAGPQAD